MKTITQYRPLIFSALLVEPAKRKGRRERNLRRWALGLLMAYIALSWGIAADTGLAVWHWQFWLIFTPMFVLGERILWQLAQGLKDEEPASVPVVHLRPSYQGRLSIPAVVRV